jgi:peptide/nickel transport system substrate-binding protein
MKLWKILFVISVAISSACSRPDRQTVGGDGAAGEPVNGDWVVVRLEAEPDRINPALSNSTYSTYVEYGLLGSQIFETLLQYDNTNWTFTKPLLAESYPEISEDHLTYIFTIRDGVQWHDGTPFSAEDVLFSAKALMTPLADTARLRSYFTDLSNVELVEGRKVRFTFAKPNFLNADNIGGSTFPIIPKHVFDPEGVLNGLSYKDMVGQRGATDANIKKWAEAFNRHPADRAPIGTGPYKFERWDTGKEIVLVRNDDYWGRKARLDKIVYRIISDYTAALAALKSGDLDFNPRLLPIQYAQQTSGEQFESQFEKVTYSIPAYYYIGWNTERPYFQDKRVRQALSMLVDVPQIIETVRFGLALPTTSHFNPSSADYNTSLKPYTYDPKRAAELLDEAGWKDTNGDGIRDKNGMPFRFEMLAATNHTLIQLLPIMKEELRKVGIDMQERQLEFTVFVENLRDHKFDANLGGWTADLVGDPTQLWHSSSIANKGSNYVSFRNAGADRLLEEARLEFDAAKRKQLYWRWQEIVHDEQPYTFVFAAKDSAAYSRRFEGVKWYPVRPGYDLNEWFVPVSNQKYTSNQTN